MAPAPGVPGGAGRQQPNQPNRRVYFPPSKQQHFDMSQQVSQTHVDRKCVQAREMLFICIKLRSDSVKLIGGISASGCERCGRLCHRRQGATKGPQGKGFASGIVKAPSTAGFPKGPGASCRAAEGPRGGGCDEVLVSLLPDLQKRH